ncbi:MAG: M50 family metallopeptidase [Candidatus Sumerlaeaceae bacterium]|nr:M50 family metallopeptidase [Candidatus Sumerlaeaceae bacterium]
MTMAGRRRPGPADDEAVRHPALREERKAEWIRETGLPFQKRSYLIQLACFVGLLLVWQIPIVNPVKLLVVLFHEFSHVIAGYATGATIFGMAIDPGGAGVTLGMGGNQLLIVAAGYIGSLLMGATLYALSAIWKPGDVWIVLTVFSGASLVMGWLNDFTAIFGYGTLIVMIWGAVYLSDGSKRVILRIVGTASCLYPVLDVAAELFGVAQEGFQVRGDTVGSDVIALARLTGMSWELLGIFWAGAGLGLLAFLVTWSARQEALGEVRRELFRRGKSRRRADYQPYDPSHPGNTPTYTIK